MSDEHKITICYSLAEDPILSTTDKHENITNGSHRTDGCGDGHADKQ